MSLLATKIYVQYYPNSLLKCHWNLYSTSKSDLHLLTWAQLRCLFKPIFRARQENWTTTWTLEGIRGTRTPPGTEYTFSISPQLLLAGLHSAIQSPWHDNLSFGSDDDADIHRTQSLAADLSTASTHKLNYNLLPCPWPRLLQLDLGAHSAFFCLPRSICDRNWS